MFHDATVSRFVVFNNELHVETEEFHVGPNEKMLPARILISAIGDIYYNGEKVNVFQVESDDAEILELHMSSAGVELTLIWHFWNPNAQDVLATYLFPTANLHTESIDGGQLVSVPGSGD